MTAADWETFYDAQLAAAGALLGLVFVGLSLNLEKILSYPWLPNRALLALLVLMAILIVASFMLMPGQSTTTLGIEIAAVGLFFVAVDTAMEGSALRKVRIQNRDTFIANLILLELGLVPYVVGGVLLVVGATSGFYWIAAGVMISFIKAVLDAWVLLVEINR